MSKAFTVLTVENTKPDPVKRLEIPDPALSGLYLVVQPTGGKSWALRYRHGGKTKKLTLGRWPVTGLADARIAASVALDQIQHGTDPAAIRAAQAATNPTPAKADDRDHVVKVLDRYARDHLSQIRSGDTVKRELTRTLVASFGNRPVGSITRREIRDLLEPIRERTPVTSNRVLTYIRAFMNWCQSQDLIETNPTDGIKKPVKENSRERVLSDDEIRWFWNACERAGQPWGPMGKLLLLTGQRLGEVSQMTDNEITGNLWSLSGARTKNKRPHTVPLSKQAIATLESVKRIRADGAPGFVFTTTGMTPVQGFDGARKILADLMTTAANEGRSDSQPRVEIEHWTFHDLRRTAATGMASIGQSVAVIEAVLNHVSGVRSGVAGTYNRHAYDAEKRAALTAWANHVIGIVSGKPTGNIVEFRHG